MVKQLFQGALRVRPYRHLGPVLNRLQLLRLCQVYREITHPSKLIRNHEVPHESPSSKNAIISVIVNETRFSKYNKGRTRRLA